jgi:hypothetical protein
MRGHDRWSAGVLCLVGLIAIVEARTLRIGTVDRPGPGFFPFYLAVALVLVGVALLVRSVTTRRGHPTDGLRPLGPPPKPPPGPDCAGALRAFSESELGSARFALSRIRLARLAWRLRLAMRAAPRTAAGARSGGYSDRLLDQPEVARVLSPGALSPGDRPEPPALAPGDRPEGWRVFATVLALVAYTVGLEPLGFLGATLALLLFLFRAVGRQSWPVALSGSVATTFLTYALFRGWLQVRLPPGLLGP